MFHSDLFGQLFGQPASAGGLGGAFADPRMDPSNRHTSPKGHFKGPANIYQIDYAPSGIHRSRMHADLFTQVFVLRYRGTT